MADYKILRNSRETQGDVFDYVAKYTFLGDVNIDFKSKKLFREIEDVYYDEACFEISILIKERLNQVVYEVLTPHQFKVYHLVFIDEMTYDEAAKVLGINYTGVSHALQGEWNVRLNKYHGGLIRKVDKAIRKDPVFESLLNLRALIYSGDTETCKLLLDYIDSNPGAGPQDFLKESYARVKPSNTKKAAKALQAKRPKVRHRSSNK